MRLADRPNDAGLILAFQIVLRIPFALLRKNEVSGAIPAINAS